MSLIPFTLQEEVLERAVQRARAQNLRIPTLEEQKHPEKIPREVQEKLSKVGLWDVDSLNLFRITWKNEPTPFGGGYGKVNYLELPSSLTGVPARIIGLVGKWFPTGAHKVGASFGCLVPPLVTGQFDPTTKKAVWPSTGNYCRGGAFNSKLLGCESIAILPEEMSRERFSWLATIAGEVIATKGSESNVKEIFDKCWELKKTRQDILVFNQFEEQGNYLWHHEVTGSAMQEVLEYELGHSEDFAGVVLSSGSGGTLAAADFLKKHYPHCKLGVAEALQCPTLLNNGFGAHRIEGIGDKHIPWIHNVRSTDLAIAIDDTAPMHLTRLFNEPVGKEFLAQITDPRLIEKLSLLGISGVSNLLSAIKFARYYELGKEDLVLTVFTDSMELYHSRLEELTEDLGPYTKDQALIDYHRYLLGTTTDHMEELTYATRKRIHNLKYYTWVEQQGKTVEELQEQWYGKNYWKDIVKAAGPLDQLICAFNERVAICGS